MKKFFAVIATAVACLVCALGFVGCTKNTDKLKVFVPDGAPALSLAALNQAEGGDKFDVSVVKANTINSYVTGKREADIAIVPVNAAVKLLGNGENYKMLGTVTHGNLYLLKKQSAQDITTVGDLSKLVGKTVGVNNLANIPGLTFKIILADNGLEYNELKDGASAVEDKVNLIETENSSLTSFAYDYQVRPEPAATTLVKANSQQRWTDPDGWVFAASLQTLYGGENGYPQAVAVAKTSVIANNKQAVSAFISSFEVTQNWLADENTSAQKIYNAVDNMTKGDLSHAFTANNLTKDVIANCGIKYESNTTGKAAVLAFMEKLNAVSNESWGTPAEAFFY